MKYTAVNAKHNFGQVLDEVQHNTITITRHNRDIAVMYSSKRIEKIKKNLLGEYLLEQVESGQMDLLDALEMQATIMQDIEKADKEIENGDYEIATPAFFERIRAAALKD